MDIYEILSSKPHNPHYLKKYTSFIENCKLKNLNIIPEYTEDHHICPKAKSLFPEYRSFRLFPENKVKLTHRQHYIAHWLLWKVYNNWDMTYCFNMMSMTKNRGSYIYQKAKEALRKFPSHNLERKHIRNPDGKVKSVKISELDSYLNSGWKLGSWIKDPETYRKSTLEIISRGNWKNPMEGKYKEPHRFLMMSIKRGEPISILGTTYHSKREAMRRLKIGKKKLLELVIL